MVVTAKQGHTIQQLFRLLKQLGSRVAANGEVRLSYKMDLSHGLVSAWVMSPPYGPGEYWPDEAGDI